MRSQTGAIITLGNRAIILDSTKQKVNARSSIKSEMVDADNTSLKILWTKQSIEEQGHIVKANMVYQDNTSAVKLEMSGKLSLSKRTRHFDIKFFYFIALINRGKMQVEYCPTSKMIVNYMANCWLDLSLSKSETASWMQDIAHGWSAGVL